ncbi:WD domain, G-beta repeat containing protein, putative [Babesia bigemina]|uniref:WD40 repeat-containing protein SMU1 n=1 Tax=Babesia bigemina TaxID=5866 RepID=A0A061D5I7_BABBI|nr:WD domain, G-beta repeat containing protein, putative [Babesia bigemina]CDR95793.1 WD domain, G-beta repeat containing protein, putative [Babesia bigemina]|eukprot:XP_012767979.1 WD domain, G-beta repeat containing protein, putative [Babesia bigemina]
MDKTVKVASEDVIKLILQYLKENRLSKSLMMLQEEAGVSLNSVPSVDSLVADAQMGRWNQVLDAVDTMSLSQETLFKLYDQIIRELVDLRESTLATAVLENALPMREMEREHPDKYRILADLCRKRPAETREIYASSHDAVGQQPLTKDKRRAIVAEALKSEIDSVPPSRLTALLGMAMKWQHNVGIISSGDQFDVFRNTSTTATRGDEPSVKEVAKIIRFADNAHPECAIFTPNGQYLISGSSDGFIEVWNWHLGQLDPDLEYQNKDQFMLHETLIVSLAVSRDSEILASGDKDGHIRIWKIATGECVRKMNNAHDGAVTCMTFSRDSTSLLTGSFDKTARVHGLKSGKPLRTFKGHHSIVNAAIYSYDGTKVITGSSDGYVKIWDSRTTDLLKSFLAFTGSDPSSGLKPETPRPVNSILSLPYTGGDELIIVCTRSSSLSIYKLNGICVKHYSVEETAGNNFLDVAVSRKLNWVYSVGEGNWLYCFNKAGALEHSFKVHDKDVIGIAHHPQDAVVATWALDGTIKLLYP